jgi:hypothetical protein
MPLAAKAPCPAVDEATVERAGRLVLKALGQVLPLAPVGAVGEMWRKTLRDKRRPGMLACRHLEVCVFSHLAAELRSGDIAVVGSDSYANLHAQLMTW